MADYFMFYNEINQYMIYLVIYVDDIVITRENEYEIQLPNLQLQNNFKIMDL